MNQENMLAICQTLFAMHPTAERFDEADYTFAVFRFSETEHNLVTEGLLVNPEIPPEGTHDDWLRLPQNQALGVSFLLKAGKLAELLAEQIINHHAQRHPDETLQEFAARMKLQEMEAKGHA